MSLSGLKENDFAFSSQNGVPVSGLKCHWTTSRTCASSWSLAALICSGDAWVAVTGFNASLSLLDRVEVNAVVDVQHAVGRHGRYLQRLVAVNLLGPGHRAPP